MSEITIDNKIILLTPAGFLCNCEDWSEAVAKHIAAEENIQLTAEHFAVIYLLRSFYQAHETIPSVRSVITLIKKQLGDELGNSIALYKLFPQQLKQICRIAGLPKPKHCM